MRRVSATPAPSSVKNRTPSSAISPIGASRSPARSTVIAPEVRTSHGAARRARAPPARSRRGRSPGWCWAWRGCRCSHRAPPPGRRSPRSPPPPAPAGGGGCAGRPSPGLTTQPPASRVRSPDRSLPTPAIRPSSITTSAVRSPFWSMTRPPFSTIVPIRGPPPRARASGPRRAEDPVHARAHHQVQHRHAGGDAVADLVDDHRAGQIGHLGADLHPSVHRTGVHHEGVVLHAVHAPAREAVPGRVLPQGWQERFGHALALHPEEVRDVEGGQHGVEVVAHLGRPARERWRQQGRWRHQRDLGTEGGERDHVGPSDSTVLDVADDADVQAIEAAPLLTDRVAVEQRLGGVLVPAVTGVDDPHAVIEPPGDLPRHAGGSVAHDDRVHAHGFDGEDGVAERLALLDRGGAHAEGHGVC